MAGDFPCERDPASSVTYGVLWEGTMGLPFLSYLTHFGGYDYEYLQMVLYPKFNDSTRCNLIGAAYCKIGLVS